MADYQPPWRRPVAEIVRLIIAGCVQTLVLRLVRIVRALNREEAAQGRLPGPRS